MPHTPFTNPFINWVVQLSSSIYDIYIHTLCKFISSSERIPKLVTYASMYHVVLTYMYINLIEMGKRGPHTYVVIFVTTYIQKRGEKTKVKNKV